MKSVVTTHTFSHHLLWRCIRVLSVGHDGNVRVPDETDSVGKENLWQPGRAQAALCEQHGMSVRTDKRVEQA
jgi:hypothetical protein